MAGLPCILAMTIKSKKRRRPPGACLHLRKRVPVVASVFTLMVLLSRCRGVGADNSNVNYASQPAGPLPVEPVLVEDRCDGPCAPETTHVNVVGEIDRNSGDEEGGEEELLPPKIVAPSEIGAGDDGDEGDGPLSFEADSGAVPARSAEATADSPLNAAVKENTASVSLQGRDAVVNENTFYEPTTSPVASAAAAEDAVLSSPSPTDADCDDLADPDEVAAADAAAAATAAAAAATAAAAGVLERHGRQRQTVAPLVDEDGGGGEGVHVSSAPDITDSEEPGSEGQLLVAGADTSVGGSRSDDEQLDAVLVEKARKASQGDDEVLGGDGEDFGRPGRESRLGEERVEEAAEAAILQELDQEREETMVVQEAGVGIHEDDLSAESRMPELVVSAVIADYVGDDGVEDAVPDQLAFVADGDDDAATESEHGAYGVAADDADDDGGDGADAITPSTKTEEETQPSPQPPPSPPGFTTSEAGLALEVQASPLASLQHSDPGKTTVPPPAEDDDLKEDSTSEGESNMESALRVDDSAASSPASGGGGSPVVDMHPSTNEEKRSAEPEDGQSASTGTAPAEVVQETDLLPRRGEAQSRDGGAYDREGDGDGGGSGNGKDEGAGERPPTAWKRAARRPASVAEEVGALPSIDNGGGGGGRDPRTGRNGGGPGYGRGGHRLQEKREEGDRPARGGLGSGGVGVPGDYAEGGGDGEVDGESVSSRGPPEELAQRVRDMEAEVVRKLLAEEDEKSLLDIWVEQAREYVLTQTVPPTDAECDFNWSRLRCEPKCTCGARLRFGDYTPGRACRLLHPWERSPELCGIGNGEDGSGGAGDGSGAVWDPSDEPALKRVLATTASVLGRLRRAYEARVAPPSDPECSFSLDTRQCEPHPVCRLRLRWGDLSLSRACRLAAIPEKKK